jgi:hypothetical protein
LNNTETGTGKIKKRKKERGKEKGKNFFRGIRKALCFLRRKLLTIVFGRGKGRANTQMWMKKCEMNLDDCSDTQEKEKNNLVVGWIEKYSSLLKVHAYRE